jgi:hypothetical protein
MAGLVQPDRAAAKMGRNIGLLWTAIVEDENRRGLDPALLEEATVAIEGIPAESLQGVLAKLALARCTAGDACFSVDMSEDAQRKREQRLYSLIDDAMRCVETHANVTVLSMGMDQY